MHKTQVKLSLCPIANHASLAMYQPSIIGPSIALPTYTYLDIIVPRQLWHKFNYFSFFPFFEKKRKRKALNVKIFKKFMSLG
jgi:hypothetical protein